MVMPLPYIRSVHMSLLSCPRDMIPPADEVQITSSYVIREGVIGVSVHVLLVNEPTSTHDWEDVIRPCIWMMIRSGVALQYATWTLVRQVLKCDRGGICQTSVVALQYVSHYSACTI
jgi:hypothetical protein